MADEKKESKGSNLIQLKVSNRVKEYLQEQADNYGFPINTYIYHLIINDMKEKEKAINKNKIV